MLPAKARAIKALYCKSPFYKGRRRLWRLDKKAIHCMTIHVKYNNIEPGLDSKFKTVSSIPSPASACIMCN